MNWTVKWVAMAGFLLCAISLRAITADGQKKLDESITPVLDRCELRIGDRTLKPSKTTTPWENEHLVGKLRVVVDKGKVTARSLPGNKDVWKAETPAGLHLSWLAADDDIAYFLGYQADEKTGESTAETPAKVRCLDLKSGKWIESLPAGPSRAKPKEKSEIASILPGKDYVVVLTNTVNDDAGDLASYTITCFRRGQAKPIWVESFLAAGANPQPGVMLLWAARRPDAVQPDVRPLTWMDNSLLVCAGPTQDLVCLDPQSGKTTWRLERVWEYDRSFIGPSVWQHFMARADGKEFDKQFRCSIIGGPVFVSGDDNRSSRVFVAVSKGPVSSYTSYLSQAWLYEIDTDGKPAALVSLPRLVNGGQVIVSDGGVVWACQDRAFLRATATSGRGNGFGMGPGGPDCLCQLDWYRRLSDSKPTAWLTAGAAGDPVAFGKSVAFRLPQGGYVTNAKEGVYRFPVLMVNLTTGLDQRLTLEVPFEGKLPEPKSNYSRTKAAGGAEQWQTIGPYVLAITQLRVEGDVLRITLGMEDWSAVLDFSVGKTD